MLHKLFQVSRIWTYIFILHHLEISVMGTALENLQVETSNEVIKTYLYDCYILKARHNADSSKFANSDIDLPVVQMDFSQNSSKITDRFKTSRSNFVTKHNRQCIVYYMSLAEFQQPDYNGLLDMFEIPTLQVEATYSYLITTHLYQTSTQFLLSSKLKNFQHRIFISPIISDHISFQFRLHYFCYFCNNGTAVIVAGKVYKSIAEISYLSNIFPDVSNNFYGKTMRVVVPPAPPLALIGPSKSNPNQVDIYGQHAPILKGLASHFNFSFSLHPSPLTGIKFPNGTWNGIMGEILYGRADIGLSVASSYDRYQIVDVTTYVYYAFLVLVSTKPSPTFEWQAVFYPFEVNAWLAFSVSTLMTFFISKWMHNSSIKFQSSRSNQFGIKQLLTNYKSFYVTVGNLLEQGPPFDISPIPIRIFITFWMFFAMIITTSYRSKLFTFLTFPKIEIPPSSFLELAESTYKFGMKHIGGIAFIFITKSPLQYVRNIGEKMQVYNDKFTCLDRTFKDRFTCIIYRAYIDYLNEIRYWKLRRKFHISDFVSPPVGSGWVLPKHSPWLLSFNKASYPTYEMGLAEKYLNDYQVDIAKVIRANAHNSTQTFDLNMNYKNDDANGPQPLIMANLYAAFAILLIGAIVSSLFVGFEIISVNKYRNSLKRRQRKLYVQLKRKWAQRKASGEKTTFRNVVQVIGQRSQEILVAEGRNADKLFEVVASTQSYNRKH